jgi:hypothetical protein
MGIGWGLQENKEERNHAFLYFIPHLLVEGEMRSFLATNKFHHHIILIPTLIALGFKT